MEQEAPVKPNEAEKPSPAKFSVSQMWDAALWPLLFAAICWAVHFISERNPGANSAWGIFPRTSIGLSGILTAPFIHADLDHLLANTLPILLVGTGIFHFYRSLAFRVIALIWILGGFWVWLIARPSWHIGASGLIYGGVVFLFFSGVFRRDIRLMAISFLVVFLYGSLAWGILPIHPAQSWESHLSGSMAGLLAAIYYRHDGPQRQKFDWEDEPLADDTEHLGAPSEDEQTFTIRYEYKPDKKQVAPGEND